MTEASEQVLQGLRSPEDLQWHVVPLITRVLPRGFQGSRLPSDRGFAPSATSTDETR